MTKEILEQLTWKDIEEIYRVADKVYYTSTIDDSDEKIYTEALNLLKGEAE